MLPIVDLVLTAWWLCCCICQVSRSFYWTFVKKSTTKTTADSAPDLNPDPHIRISLTSVWWHGGGQIYGPEWGREQLKSPLAHGRYSFSPEFEKRIHNDIGPLFHRTLTQILTWMWARTLVGSGSEPFQKDFCFYRNDKSISWCY